MNEDQPPSRQKPTLIQRVGRLFKNPTCKYDLRQYLQKSREADVITPEESAMINGVLEVSELRVRDIMLPKSKMVVIPVDISLQDALDIVLDSGHSRFPVAEDDDITGILLAKDLLKYIHQEHFILKSIIRSAKHIPESKPLNILLREFRLQRLHMAIVTNEYGEVAGLVTIEDVLEQIVGDIDDEYDQDEQVNIKQIDDGRYWVSALTEIENFNHYFQTDFAEAEMHTIGGFILSQFGYVPKTGEHISLSNIDFTIKKADDRRILALLIKRQPLH